MEKKILVVVDMQNDFIDGVLGTKEAQAVVPLVADHIRKRKEEGYALVATLDTHHENYMATSEGKKLPVPHCIRQTLGWQLNPLVQEALGQCRLVEKASFGSLELPGILREIVEDTGDVTIELIGVCTDICVVSNALILKAHFPEAAVQVQQGCCAGVTPQKHEAALETMRCCQIDVI